MKNLSFSMLTLAAVITLQACGGGSGGAAVTTNAIAGGFGGTGDPVETVTVPANQARYGNIFVNQTVQLDVNDPTFTLTASAPNSGGISWDTFYHATVIPMVARCGNACLLGNSQLSGGNPFANTTTLAAGMNLNVSIFLQYVSPEVNSWNNDGVEFQQYPNSGGSTVYQVIYALLPQSPYGY